MLKVLTMNFFFFQKRAWHKLSFVTADIYRSGADIHTSVLF